MSSSPTSFISIFNDVLGPIMRGQSSSHTAGSYFIGRHVRELLGEPPAEAKFTFHPEGSYARVFQAQGADLAFAAGLLGWSLTDERFPAALTLAARNKIHLEFLVASFPEADHPNSVKIHLHSPKTTDLTIIAKSIGGGAIQIVKFNNWAIDFEGKDYLLLLQCQSKDLKKLKSIFLPLGKKMDEQTTDSQSFISVRFKSKPHQSLFRKIKTISPEARIWTTSPHVFSQKGRPLFSSGADIEKMAREKNLSLGNIALEYESTLLGLDQQRCLAEMKKRLRVMEAAIRAGQRPEKVHLQLLEPSAHKIIQAIDKQTVALGGPHARAAARAMAVMHHANSLGVICAAPTGGSAGVIPGVITTLREEKKLDETQTLLALFAAGAIGLIVAQRATFAAEVAGCQVEIGAAGAMAAAAVVDACGGTASQALQAAAISLQNTMGSVCDLVQGICEIPCHTRNAAAAASAFVCADLILGGYDNPIPLDDTIDAALSSGKMLPPQLRCTSLGGLAITPSALALKKKRIDNK
ncbi:MAG: hypothetical protein DRI99_01640 [Candidatus Aminicenantes bacterium]|nr:MAG: hypothetical protein DRI99_01640 [Candidatus Aminicenantes bacterium]